MELYHLPKYKLICYNYLMTTPNFYLVIQYEFGTPNQYFQVRIKLFPEAWAYVSKLEKGSSMVDC